MDVPGLRVYLTGLRPPSTESIAFPRGDGLVLGTLFDCATLEREPGARVQLSESESDRIVASGGTHLVDRYWGRYVSFICSTSNSTLRVLRDPTGVLPCYYAAISNLLIFFSWADDARMAGLDGCTIDWHYIARHLCCADPQSRATGLREISQVHPGECIELRDGKITASRQLWDPVSIARREWPNSIEESTRHVRARTEQVVTAWASRYPRIVHLLSGGLDSSVLLHCLASAPSRPRITCLNYYGLAGVNSDERFFARLALSGHDCELIERPSQSPAHDLRGMLDCARTTVPLGLIYRTLTQEVERKLAQDTGAAAYFTGVGGDAVFYQGPVPLALADQMRAHFGTNGCFDLALSIARMDNLSLGSVLWQACRALLPIARVDEMVKSVRERSVVSPDVLRAAANEPDFFWHRYTATRGRLPPAKLRHLYQMRGYGVYFYSPFAERGDPEYVCPLISQPLVDLCLQIPVYMHTAAGWDRALERRAFMDVLPSRVVQRRRKGSIGVAMNVLLQNNLEFVRELMLEGQLIEHQLLDRRKVEAALTGANVGLSPAAAEIIGEHLSTEAWLRRWSFSDSA
ncbi:hypothetical protein JM946_10505 [Steroidobacter sp. S1-65]|uniref:asparagine synthase (glutamine-hydrolyzing) n=1 Tax=Steroidobacter gossypii TaxID=2805490 RepID=A0ABS1WW35_9GAMM|nr:asparagine synthase-related protein [Steroidobacter gossypii]MBM0105185.1 hypothetical protein [Steroidobacter gossypii]